MYHSHNARIVSELRDEWAYVTKVEGVSKRGCWRGFGVVATLASRRWAEER